MKQILSFLIGSLVCFFLVMFLFFSHKGGGVALTVNRFEQDLFSINAENGIEKLNKWNEMFGSLNEIFAMEIMQISPIDEEKYCKALLAFTTNKDIREAYDSTSLLFSDFSQTQNILESAFGHFSTHFPAYPIPEITTFFGGFHYGVITYDNNIGIGLENFLGKNSKYYKYLGDPQYLRFQKQKRFICSNVMEVWFNEFFQRFLGGRDLLSQIIYKGKMMYFLDEMLPNVKMEDKFRFTIQQMAWAEKNEYSIWEYFIEEDLLFSKKENEFRSFVNYAPFAKGMPNEAPARIAYFIGYKMVKKYMSNNKIDIEELMYLTDSREFLRKSEYKPNK